MFYNVRFTYTEMYISDFSKNLSKMFQIYSDYTTALQADLREG